MSNKAPNKIFIMKNNKIAVIKGISFASVVYVGKSICIACRRGEHCYGCPCCEGS